MQTFINRYGPFAVFLARFTPGLRFMAGPLAGTVRMPVLKFVVSNTIGALLYVPLMVAAGYGVGYGFGQTIERAQRAVGEVEHLRIAHRYGSRADYAGSEGRTWSCEVLGSPESQRR